MEIIGKSYNIKDNDPVVILTLSELANIIKIAKDFEKSKSERCEEIMNVFKARQVQNITSVSFNPPDAES